MAAVCGGYYKGIAVTLSIATDDVCSAVSVVVGRGAAISPLRWCFNSAPVTLALRSRNACNDHDHELPICQVAQSKYLQPSIRVGRAERHRCYQVILRSAEPTRALNRLVVMQHLSPSTCASMGRSIEREFCVHFIDARPKLEAPRLKPA